MVGFDWKVIDARYVLYSLTEPEVKRPNFQPNFLAEKP